MPSCRSLVRLPAGRLHCCCHASLLACPPNPASPTLPRPTLPQNALPFPANFMPDGGLELLPAGGEGGANGTVEAEAPVAPGETVTLRYFVPERWVGA